MTSIKALMLAGAVSLAASAAGAASYTYVGSWSLGGAGPVWWENPAVYTSQEAAALLFGGEADDYAISTQGTDASLIDFSAWLDGWGDSFTYAEGGKPAAQDFSLDASGLGYNGCEAAGIECMNSAYSALVVDHFFSNGSDDGQRFVNYAFRVSEVPVPAAGGLLALALGGLGALRVRRRA